MQESLTRISSGGVIFQNRMTKELAPYPHLLPLSADAVALIEAMRTFPFDAADTRILRVAFASSIRIIWAVMTCLAGVSLIASCFIKGYSLNQALVTDQGFVNQAKSEVVGVEEGLPTEASISLDDSGSKSQMG
jgi:hypothetical protein